MELDANKLTLLNNGEFCWIQLARTVNGPPKEYRYWLNRINNRKSIRAAVPTEKDGDIEITWFRIETNEFEKQISGKAEWKFITTKGSNQRRIALLHPINPIIPFMLKFKKTEPIKTKKTKTRESPFQKMLIQNKNTTMDLVANRPLTGRVLEKQHAPNLTKIPDFINNKQKDRQRDHIFLNWMEFPYMKPITSRMSYNGNNMYARIKSNKLCEYFVYIQDPLMAKETKCITIFDGKHYLIFAHIRAITRRFYYLWKILTDSYKASKWIQMEPGSEIWLRQDKVPNHHHENLMKYLCDDKPPGNRE